MSVKPDSTVNTEIKLCYRLHHHDYHECLHLPAGSPDNSHSQIVLERLSTLFLKYASHLNLTVCHSSLTPSLPTMP